jgi:membrane protein implicated in regulation of membrane protease activity
MNDELLSKLFIGAGAPLTGLAVSHATLNLWLQTSSLIIGVIVGLLTLFSFFKKDKKTKKPIALNTQKQFEELKKKDKLEKDSI